MRHLMSPAEVVTWEPPIPEGRLGPWEVSRRDGPLTLFHEGEVWMSVSPDEIEDHRELVEVAQGRVLLMGLGLGMAAWAVAAKRDPLAVVQHITVVELEPDVIELVGRPLHEAIGPRLELVQADALAWDPGPETRFDVIWHDIWQYPDPANYPQMLALEERWATRCWWQDAWSRDRIVG